MVFVPYYILILFFTIIVDYIAGIYIEKSEGKTRKWYLIASLIANIGCLAFFKYYNFLNDNVTAFLDVFDLKNNIPDLAIVLPIGLSFHTFQAMSYTIEVFRGNHKAEKHLGIYALYVLYYPQLVAGPIERPQNLLDQYHAVQYFSYDNLMTGLRLMLWGFFKKVVIADRLALVVDFVYRNPDEQNALTYLIAMIFFSIQIYCDFSGYSDIAIGASKTMGIDLMQNFNVPYWSQSITEFWRRWHISLSTWFRDYLYISLGGNRVSRPRWYLNMLIVFLISGLWHGANWTFVVWGAIHGIGLMIENLFGWNEKAKNWIVQGVKILATFIFVTFAWIFFRATNFEQATHILSTTINGLPNVFSYVSSLHFLSEQTEVGLTLSFTLIAFLLICELKYGAFVLEKFAQDTQSKMLRWAVYYFILLMILFAKNEAQTFIYFQF